MEFRNREELNAFLDTLKYIGKGIQGQSLLDEKTNQVYKIFSEEELENAGYAGDVGYRYTYDGIMRFSHIKNDTFVWPSDVIMTEGLVAGYTHSYFNGENFCDFNDPFGVNLDNLSYAVYKANEDIKLLSKKKVEINDLMYNLMFDGKTIKVVDTFEFCKGNVTYSKNVEDFNDEIKMFLVNDYFENIVLNDKRLRKIYYDNTSALTFLREFKEYLEKIKKQEIKYLGQARDLVNTDISENDGRYTRNYSQKRFLR